MLLAGDIGGTKTNLAVISPEKGPREPVAEETFPSSHYPSLEALVGEFLAGVDMKPERATFGVAGPVVGGEATITNLPWKMKEAQLQEELDLSSVTLINDLVAVAYAVPWLERDDLHILSQGQPAEGGTKAIIAPGTGLGEAFLTWDGSRYRPYASEGGHTDFAPTNSFELGLLAYLQERFDHVSCERVCSGLGLPNIYAYLKDSGAAKEPGWLAEELARADDATPIIVNAALDDTKSCELCVATLQAFVSILGTEAGNLALKVLSTGGVYLGGGIPPRILSALEDGLFLETFRRKGRMSRLLAEMPVYVILNRDAALLGASAHALEP